MPALLPKLSEDALIPSSPSQRRKQRLVISLAVFFVSIEGSISDAVPPDLAVLATGGGRSDAADTADVNDPDLITSSKDERFCGTLRA